MNNGWTPHNISKLKDAMKIIATRSCNNFCWKCFKVEAVMVSIGKLCGHITFCDDCYLELFGTCDSNDIPEELFSKIRDTYKDQIQTKSDEFEIVFCKRHEKKE